MVAQETNLNERYSIMEQDVIRDQRVQYEYRELNSLLEHIAEAPEAGDPTPSDPTWWIDDPEIFRWLITMEGKVNLERISRFRKSLLREDGVVDAQVINLEHGQIQIRVITTGGLPMGPLELAVGKLTARSLPADA